MLLYDWRVKRHHITSTSDDEASAGHADASARSDAPTSIGCHFSATPHLQCPTTIRNDIKMLYRRLGNNLGLSTAITDIKRPRRPGRDTCMATTVSRLLRTGFFLHREGNPQRHRFISTNIVPVHHVPSQAQKLFRYRFTSGKNLK